MCRDAGPIHGNIYLNTFWSQPLHKSSALIWGLHFFVGELVGHMVEGSTVGRFPYLHRVKIKKLNDQVNYSQVLVTSLWVILPSMSSYQRKKKNDRIARFCSLIFPICMILDSADAQCIWMYA